ncbi:MAG: DMT family transporter [Zoogloeaceae bacterium]|nr:DMT family transporter [Zoogloeaceae bacterium]
MTLPDLARLVLLAALWGGSFLFMRVAVPELGPIWLIVMRVGVAALFLLLVAAALRRALPWRGNVRALLVLGLINTTLPFLLYAYAAQQLEASLLAIINATSPLFGVLIGWLAFGQRPTLRIALGLTLGLLGVATLVGTTAFGDGLLLPVLAATAAPFCYAVASHYTRRSVSALTPFANACGSMVTATLMLLPLLFLAPPLPAAGTPLPWPALTAAIALGLLCTGIAYLLYFRLIADVGAVSALSVTYLIPVFGIGWGMLFLGETIDTSTWLGLATILAGVALVTGLVDRLLPRRASPEAAP